MQKPRDFSLYGAVDLGARQSAAQRRQQAARNASSGEQDANVRPASASAFVIDVTEETFNTEVALRSRTTPVVVELRAAWSEQGKQLGPLLEKLAGAAGGAWVLARVDAEANPRLAQLFQAQSFPMVAAIIGGQVVAVIGGQMGDSFLDSISEAQLQEWLLQVLSVAEQLGLQAAPARPAEDADEDANPLPPALAAARDAMEDGDLDAAAAALEKAIADGPPDPLTKSWLAQVNLMRRVSAADPAAASRAAAAHPEDVDAQLLVADFAMAGGDAEQAFDRVLGVIKRTSGAERNTARLHLLDLFEILPPDDDRVKKARTQLTLLLF